MSDELFLSTPSARRATLYAMHSTCAPMDFYPRPPRGGRRYPIEIVEDATLFLSTPSARRATIAVCPTTGQISISIHALREEGDLDAVQWRCAHLHFYPRPPRGGRPRPCRPSSARREYFYPRPPRGGRQRGQQCGQCPYRISIHALREEGDPALLLVSSLMIYFYPRPPRGGRRFASFGGNLVDQFLSTPSARRATMWPRRRPRSCRYFYPRPPRGGRRYKLILSGTPVQFLSTPSARRATGFA